MKTFRKLTYALVGLLTGQSLRLSQEELTLKKKLHQSILKILKIRLYFTSTFFFQDTNDNQYQQSIRTFRRRGRNQQENSKVPTDRSDQCFFNQAIGEENPVGKGRGKKVKARGKRKKGRMGNETKLVATLQTTQINKVSY